MAWFQTQGETAEQQMSVALRIYADAHKAYPVLEIARDSFPAVSLNVRADNPVVRLYERAGFVKVLGSEMFKQ